MVNSTNIFWYLLDKMSRNMRRAQEETYLEKYHLQQKEKEKAEQHRANKNNIILSQLNYILAELSNTQHRIESSNDAIIKKCMDEIQKQMRKSMIDFLSTGSAVPSSIPVDPSFSNHLSRVDPELKRLSDQITILQELSRKIKEDIPELSESEQQIVQILLCKSFLENQAVVGVQGTINLGQHISKCLGYLEKYSEDFFNELDDADFVKHREDPKDFQLTPDEMQSFFQKLDENFQEMTKLLNEIKEIKVLFSERFSLESLFSVHVDLLSLSKSTLQLEAELERKTLIFFKFRETVVKFIENENNKRESLFLSITYDLDESCMFHTQFNEIQQQLEDALKRIKC
jgi:hypothetical protein